MSTLICPNCGWQQLDELARDDDGVTCGCRKCRTMSIITLLRTEYHSFELEPTPLFETADEKMIREIFFPRDKGVTL